MDPSRLVLGQALGGWSGLSALWCLGFERAGVVMGAGLR